MSGWVPLADGAHAIVHLSDLHFGLPGSEDVFDRVRSFIDTEIGDRLGAVLVTGDVVDSPEKTGFLDDAFQSLTRAWPKTPLYVIGGNHDLYKKGNLFRFFWDRPKLVRSFHDTFRDHVVGTKRRVLDIGSWRIGLVGVETAESADYFARGYLEPTQLDAVVRASREQGFDLWILMAHHHLLPVKGLEERNQSNSLDLANVTYLVNGASAADRLAGSGIDLVLHGHEHCQNLLRYDNLRPAQREVVILGAGSATGVNHRRRCEATGSSFNVVVLGADGSVRNRVLAFAGATWDVHEDRELFAPEYLRRSRIYRDEAAADRSLPTTGPLRLQPSFRGRVDGEICKSVVFSGNRDISVDLSLEGWRIDTEQCWFPIANSTGMPVAPRVELVVDGNARSVDAEIVANREQRGEWFITWNTPQALRDRALGLRITYTWRAGALLTAQELAAVGDRAHESRRGRGQEFSTLRAFDLVAVGRLFVMVSRRFAPNDLEVLVFDEHDRERPEAAQEASRCLTKLGEGRFLLTIRYPRVGWRYVVAWTLRNWTLSAAAARRIAGLRRQADVFLERLREHLPADVEWSLALYLRDELGLGLAAADPGATLEPHVALEGDRSFLVRACWGVPLRVDCGRDDDAERRARIAGLMPGERTVWTFPLPLDMSQDSEIIGVARFSIPKSSEGWLNAVELVFGRAVVSALTLVKDGL